MTRALHGKPNLRAALGLRGHLLEKVYNSDPLRVIQGSSFITVPSRRMLTLI